MYPDQLWLSGLLLQYIGKFSDGQLFGNSLSINILGIKFWKPCLYSLRYLSRTMSINISEIYFWKSFFLKFLEIPKKALYTEKMVVAASAN